MKEKTLKYGLVFINNYNTKTVKDLLTTHKELYQVEEVYISKHNDEVDIIHYSAYTQKRIAEFSSFVDGVKTTVITLQATGKLAKDVNHAS